MGIEERKEKQKHEIQIKILAASMNLFLNEGFKNVTIRKIADLIEYSPTTLYLYFKDKNEILFQLCEIGFVKLEEQNKNLNSVENPIIRLMNMGENFIRFGLENPEYYDLMFIQIAPMKALEAIKDGRWTSADQALDKLKNIVSECLAKNYLKSGDVNTIALTVWATVHGLVSLAIRDRLNKLVAEDKVIPMMYQSLHWLIETLKIPEHEQIS